MSWLQDNIGFIFMLKPSANERLFVSQKIDSGDTARGTESSMQKQFNEL